MTWNYQHYCSGFKQFVWLNINEFHDLIELSPIALRKAVYTLIKTLWIHEQQQITHKESSVICRSSHTCTNEIDKNKINSFIRCTSLAYDALRFWAVLKFRSPDKSD